ncbi:hypothetical protein Rhe02_20090 [Rhizocola hellebori]|uniref:Uncharacterized protein n=1 Tax=Rhizocola hellebori TaxID=1392758 RepID=A0A8J3VFA6_9ACTN|nr:hypothetical protein [Rhizocola hellebori]GIH03942.1 hypothetical protein Rhe02_20090 [Rhizocola hellebori]
MRRPVGVALTVAAGCVLAVGAATTAHAADIVSPAGACVASATWKTGGVSKTSTALTGEDIIEIPRADTVSWQGTVVGPAAASREVAGHVALALPPPFGSIDLGRWQGNAAEAQRSGTYTYDLPSVVPAGVVLDLRATHDENGQRHCTAQVGVVIAGGAFDSPLIWVALAGLVLFAAALALLGRSRTPPGAGRIVSGALLGLPLGLFLGLALVLLGVVPLASPLVTVLLGLGVVAGAVWVRWSPIRPSV